MAKMLQLVALLCSALVLGLTLTHVLQSGGSVELSGAEWLQVQNTFYGGIATVGAVAEVAGLISCAGLGAVYLVRRVGRHALVPFLVAACLLGTLLAFFFGNLPVNQKTAIWTVSTLPADWWAYRPSWEAAHAISAGLSAIAFLARSGWLIWTSRPSGR